MRNENLCIQNNNVRKQYYEFLLEEYQDNRHINLNDLGLMYYEMAYDGHCVKRWNLSPMPTRKTLPCATLLRESATCKASLLLT